MTNFQDSFQINIEVKIRQVMDFLKKHSQRVGTEQAIKDFQYGLNILNMKRKDSSVEEFHQLKEDGDFGTKTYACIANLCKYLPVRIICKSIKKAAITNAIFNTKNNKRIDTERKLEKINLDMEIEGVM
ncbi:TPA: hypothetical protein CPT81_02850 [Candidatus Gastranaerophilales bacterium HUM_20]|nr:unknown [Clostridium sp. CAG:729]DAB23167.1 MAG TPA: hypothetical protein CPT81_02850 [Candidatus Gastranaerophilales bacterium HUM_20]